MNRECPALNELLCRTLSGRDWQETLRIVAAALGALLLTSGAAAAHPHVWTTMTSEIVFVPDGSITGVRHAWTFDDMFSAFATMGMKAKKKGEFTREELQPLAQINVRSLKDFDYFTFPMVNGAKYKKDVFNEPVDYWLDYEPKAGVLTLHFTLPFKTPVHAKTMDVQVYDPSLFIYFEFAPKNAIHLVGAPPQCKATIVRAQEGHFPASLRDMFSTYEENAGMGADFAQKIAMKCP
jgi:ABC-type uncharacterized transport system substrate-binding protein